MGSLFAFSRGKTGNGEGGRGEKREQKEKERERERERETERRQAGREQPAPLQIYTAAKYLHGSTAF